LALLPVLVVLVVDTVLLALGLAHFQRKQLILE